MNSLKSVLAKYRIGKITNKYQILDIIFRSFYRQRGFAYLNQASKSLRQLLRDNNKAALYLSENALEHIKELPCTNYTVKLPGTGNLVNFVCISGDRLYTEAD